jgi:hypothetical protein
MPPTDHIPTDFLDFLCLERGIDRETAEELLKRYMRSVYRSHAPSGAEDSANQAGPGGRGGSQRTKSAGELRAGGSVPR